MKETIVIQWLQLNWPAFLLGFIPTLIAEVKGRAKTRWYLYSLACALVAWPLVTLPTIHALFLRRRNGMSEEVSRQRRRADALALIAEDSVRSYPSWISELSRKSPDGVDRRRYAYEHLGAGEALSSSAGLPIRAAITPCRTTIALFTSVMSLSSIIGLLMRWTTDFASRSLSKMSNLAGSPGAQNTSVPASSSSTTVAKGCFAKNT